MKRFIIKVAIFFLPVIVLAYSIDSFISLNLKKSNTYTGGEYQTWDAIFEGTINADILIYGSSRAWVHINPTMISNEFNVPAYNLGIDGHNFRLQNLRHELLLKYNKKPKMIIHSLDVFTLQKGANLNNPDQFLPYMLWNEEIEKAIMPYVGYKFWDYRIPLLRYYGKPSAIKTAIYMYLFPKNNPVKRIRGYQGQNISWNSDFNKAKTKLKNYRVIIDKTSMNLFEAYLKYCRSNNIFLVFVYTPEYIEGQKFIKNKSEIIKIYNNYSKKYSIPFYDFSQDEISYNKKMFYNSMHMNLAGSKLFTRKLIDTLDKNGLMNFFENRRK
ncbi:hypothetical protein [Haliscomenobacter sp.]|uniref:hypothetical protein n=1 Tax=Haliscomenobacter sp. TaxID=2717303 RepID=UPI003BA88EEB